MILVILQTIGAVLGMAGAIWVTSTKPATRRYAFLLWIGSNSAIIVAFVLMRAWPLLAMQSVYLVTSIIGFRNNR